MVKCSCTAVLAIIRATSVSRDMVDSIGGKSPAITTTMKLLGSQRLSYLLPHHHMTAQ